MNAVNSKQIKQRENRVQRVKSALVTSILSKLITIAIQVLAYPLAVRTLGKAQFGVYVTLTSTVAWLSMSNLGLGPRLTHSLARHSALGDIRSITRDFTSAFWAVTLISALLLSGMAFWVLRVPIESVFGSGYGAYESVMRGGLLLLLLLIFLTTTSSIADAAQAGFQEQYITNLWGVAGNILSLTSLFIVAKFYPTILGLIVATNIMVVTRVLNLLNLIFIKHRYLLPKPSFFALDRAWVLLSSGMLFLLAQLSGVFSHQWSVLLCGKLHGPSEAAVMAIMIQFIVLGTGIVSMVINPVWPSLTNALTHNDTEWVTQTYRKLGVMTLVYGGGIGLLIALLGNVLTSSLLHISLTPLARLGIGIYFAFHMWEYVHYFVLMGLGVNKPSSFALLARSSMGLIIGSLLARRWGSGGMACGLALSAIVLTSWYLPLLTRRALMHYHEMPHGEQTLLG